MSSFSSPSCVSSVRPRRRALDPVAASPSVAATPTTVTASSLATSSPSSRNLSPSSSATTSPGPSCCSAATSSASSSACATSSPSSALSNNSAHIASARAAIIASVSNFFDPEMRARARDLHTGHSAIAAQQATLQKSTAQMAHQNDALGALVTHTEKKVKELGSLRNWAELLEREMLTLERTVKIVHGDNSSDDDDDDDDGYSTCSESQDGSTVDVDSDSEADETGQPGPSNRLIYTHKSVLPKRQIAPLYTQPSTLSAVDCAVASFSPTAPPSTSNSILVMRSVLRP